MAQALRPLDGRPAVLVRSDPDFAEVAKSLWSSLPAPIRLLGQEKLHWDEITQQIRQKVLLEKEGRIRLPANFKSIVGQILAQVEERSAPAGLAAPTATPASHGASTVVGIDLGTTFSVAAYVDKQGQPHSIPTATGEFTTASVVFFDRDKSVLVGREAVKAAAVEPKRAAECVKRDMGARCFRRKVAEEWLPPEVLASFILKSLKHDAQRKLGNVDQAVITVPAYFDEPKRRATMDAGRLAGLEIIDIINEPTAAAVAYGFASGYLDQAGVKQQRVNLLVYDLGGGTFDVSVVQMANKQFRTIATDGDFGLGGKDWDEELAGLAAEKIQQQYRINPLDDPISEHELLREAEEAKKSLSQRTHCLMVVNHGGKRLQVEVTREEFEQASAALLRRTRTTTELLMRQAGLDWGDLQRVLLVGGSTRMPMVRNMLAELTGLPIDTSLSPEEAVAHGAALYADRLLGTTGKGSGKTAFAVTNVNSHSLGIRGIDPKTKQQRNRILIRKNTPLPAVKTKRFRTHKVGQRSVSVVILEGESRDPAACTRVGKLKLANLPPNLPARWPVYITYRYAENGRLDVSVKLQGRLAETATSFVRDNSLPEGDLLLWAEYVEESTSYLEI